MGVLSDNAIIGASNASGYNIDNSARFNNPGPGDGSPGTSRLTKTFIHQQIINFGLFLFGQRELISVLIIAIQG